MIWPFRGPLLRLMRVVIAVCAGWIFIGGVGTIVATMLIYHAYFPEAFDGDLPTISNAAAGPPGGPLFAAGMCSVGLCIALLWMATYAYNRRNIARSGWPRLHLFNRLTLVLGLTEGLSVAGLGMFGMDTALEIHMAASYGTFFSGAFAFLSDSLLTARWTDPDRTGFGLRQMRLGLALSVALCGSFFFAVFLTKSGNPFGDYMTTRVVYVAAEFLLACLSFAYAPLLGLEIWRRQPFAGE